MKGKIMAERKSSADVVAVAEPNVARAPHDVRLLRALYQAKQAKFAYESGRGNKRHYRQTVRHLERVLSEV